MGSGSARASFRKWGQARPERASGNGEMGSGEMGSGRNGVRVQILTKCLSNLRFPSITDESLHFGRQLGLRFPPIEPAELLAHVRCAAHR